MICTLTNTHRLGHQPGRARFDGAIGQAWQGRSGDLGTLRRRQSVRFLDVRGTTGQRHRRIASGLHV